MNNTKRTFNRLFFFIYLGIAFCIFTLPLLVRWTQTDFSLSLKFVVLASVVFILVAHFKSIILHTISHSSSKLIAFVFIYSVLLIVNLMTNSENPTELSPYYNQLFSIGIFVLIIWGVYQMEYVKRIICFIVGLIICSVVIGITFYYLWQFGYWNQLQMLSLNSTLFYFHNGYQFDHSVIRLQSIFTSPNLMGLYLVFFAPYFLVGLLKSENRIHSAWKILIALLVFYSLVLTYSREAWIACGLSSMIGLYILFQQKKYSFKSSNTLFLVLIIGLLIFTGKFWTRLNSMFIFDDKSILNRLKVWESTLLLIGDYPLTGIGTGNFSSLYNNFYKPLELSEFYRDAHSTWLGLTSDLGMIGIILYALIIIYALRIGFKLCKNSANDESFLYAFSLTIGLLGSVIFGLFDSYFWDLLSCMIQWTFIALLFLLWIHNGVKEGTLTQDGSLKPKSKLPSFLVTVFTGCILWLILFFYFPQPSYKFTFKKRLMKITKSFEGEIGVFIDNPFTHETYSINSDKAFHAASLVKLFILPELYQQIQDGKIKLDSKIILTKEKMNPSSGILKYLAGDPEITIQNLIRSMLIVSDSSAYQVPQLIKLLFALTKNAIKNQFFFDAFFKSFENFF